VATTQQQKRSSYERRLESLESENRALRSQLHHSQRLAAVGTMTAMIAHEFNNILTPIINYANMARKNPQLTEKAITRAAVGGERATSICQAILGMTRDDGEAPTRIRLTELVDETLSAMARDPKRDGIALTLQIPPSLTVTTRRVPLQQVLLNLLINARTAVLAGERGAGQIEMIARMERGIVRITIRDTGVGIPAENLDRIFEPFFSTRDEPDETSGGYGLGLSICKDIVTSLGGQIRVDSTVGEGTTFTLRLPS
jgi:signal transduction histidine kinase